VIRILRSAHVRVADFVDVQAVFHQVSSGTHTIWR
jgi:hypothetical protein